MCLYLSEQDVSPADNVLTYGGKKLLLTGVRRPVQPPRHAGLFGDDNDILKEVLNTVLKYADDRLSHSLKSCYPWPGASGAGAWYGICMSSRKYLSGIKTAIANAAANFPHETENYQSFSVMDASGTNLDLPSVSAFYEQVGALSYIDSNFGLQKPIPVSVGNQTVCFS